MDRKAYYARHKLLGICRSCTKPIAKGNNFYCLYHWETGKVRGRKNSKLQIIRLKSECLDAYGNKCICCGETTKEFLTVDHEGGNGNDHRRSLFKHNVGGLHMYRWLKRNNFPPGYRILCMNCNWGTRYSSVCPHKLGEVA